TFLFVESPRGERIGGGRNRLIMPADNSVTTFVEENRVTLDFFASAPSPGDPWRITLAAAGTMPLVPGVYENAQRYLYEDPQRPVLAISGKGSSVDCPELRGRFIIDEMSSSTLGGSRALETLVATVELTCQPGGPPLSVLIRFRAGDAGCLAAPDGTP